MTADRALTVRQVAAEYGVTPATVYGWIKDGHLRPLRLPGGDYRFRRADFPADPPGAKPRVPASQKLAARAMAKASEAPDSLGFVYFIRDGERGPIKIGTAIDPAARLRGLQTAHHRKLILLGTMPGNSRTELEIHRAFRASCIQGEWFKATKRLLTFIAEATGA